MKEPGLNVPSRSRGYQTEDVRDVSRSNGRGRGGKSISPDLRPSLIKEAPKSDIESGKAYGLRSSSLISAKSGLVQEDPRINPSDTKTQALIRAKAYNWLDSLHSKILNKNKTELEDRTYFELGNFFGGESSTAKTFTLDKIVLKRLYSKKQLELVDSGGFNLIDNKQVPWKEVYIRNIRIECSSSNKELDIKNIFLEVDNIMTYFEI